MKKNRWIALTALVLFLIGILFELFYGKLFSSGFNSFDYFAVGNFAYGIFAAGNFACGIFSIGIFSIGIFSIGIFNIGLYAIGIFLIAKNKKSPKTLSFKS